MRTTIYLAGPAVAVLEHVKTEHERYGIATTLSSIIARLLLGENIDDVVERPYRGDLARIAGERDRLQGELRRAQAGRRTADLHRIHREVADLFPALKTISTSLGRAKRGKGSSSADFAEAVRIEKSLDDLMAACADAIPLRRQR